jgi:hypothetical protein
MAVAVEGEFVASQKRRVSEKNLAQIIEEDAMREKFLKMMDRIDSDTQRLTEEGNHLYRENNLAEANQKYQKVMALQTERETITQNLIEELKKRQKKPAENLNSKEKERQIQQLLQEAGRLEKNNEFDQAAEKYESVFALDPLNASASQGIDRMKQRFLKTEKQKMKRSTAELEKDYQAQVNFYVEGAEKAMVAGERAKAKLFAEQALSMEQGNRKAKEILDLLQKEEVERKL